MRNEFERWYQSLEPELVVDLNDDTRTYLPHVLQLQYIHSIHHLKTLSDNILACNFMLFPFYFIDHSSPPDFGSWDRLINKAPTIHATSALQRLSL